MTTRGRERYSPLASSRIAELPDLRSGLFGLEDLAWRDVHHHMTRQNADGCIGAGDEQQVARFVRNALVVDRVGGVYSV